MAENKQNAKINVGKVLQHFNREETHSRERFLDCMFVAFTQAYGFNRIAFYEVHPSEKFAEPVLIMGPDSGEEHARIMPIVAKLSLDDLLDEDRSDVRKRTTPDLEENFKDYKIPLDAPSRFKNSFDSENSFFGKDKDGYQLTDVDRRVGGIFGTNDYALITVKGTKGKVIGWFYVDYKFSNKNLFDKEGKPVIDKEDIRVVIEATTAYFKTVRAYEAQLEYERLHAMQEGLRRVIHQIATYNTTIGGFARSITDLKDEEWIKKGLGIIIEASGNIETLVNEMRSASRRIEPKPAPFNLYEIVQKEIGVITEEERYSLIKPESDPVVYADPANTREVVLNLTKNALEAIREDVKGCILTIRFSSDSDNAYVHFHNPQHIKPDILSHIFDPYVTTKEKGLGLGLPICWGYVKANKGDLAVESSLEEGTTFTIRLPLYKGQDQKSKNFIY